MVQGFTPIPQRYPSCAVFEIEQSMRCDGGSCVGGRGIRSFHSGIGRSCCLHGYKVSPAIKSISVPFSMRYTSMPFIHKPRPSRAQILAYLLVAFGGFSYLSRVNLLARESIVVGTHVDGCVDFVSLLIWCLPRSMKGRISIVVDIMQKRELLCGARKFKRLLARP